MQLGEGTGIDSLHERDKEEAVNDPHSTIASLPDDPETKAIVAIFNTTSLEHNMTGLAGFNYHSLKDNIKWRKLSRKKYVPLLQGCMTSYTQGIRERAK